jgi:enoyl-CoA hydratase
MALIELARDHAVATISLNRPEKRNALTMEMLALLGSELEALASDDSIRVVVLRGNGSAFCVGADVIEFAGHDSNSARRSWIAKGHRVAGILAELPQPTIAALHGHSFGGGLELALACDFRVATATSRLALPEVGLGTLPGWGGTGRLAAAVGPVKAKEMVLLSRSVDGTEALGLGLVSMVCDDEVLAASVDEMASALAAQPPIAVQLAKQVMNAAVAPSHQLETYEALAGALSVATYDLHEGVLAFRDKRRPEFEGR